MLIIHALNWAKRSPRRQPRIGMIELLSPPPRLPGASHLVSGEIVIFLVQQASENEFFSGLCGCLNIFFTFQFFFRRVGG